MIDNIIYDLILIFANIPVKYAIFWVTDIKKDIFNKANTFLVKQ